jgi:hypothetical protein
MKIGFLAILAGLALGVVGCVHTVTDQKTAGVYLSRDKVQGNYKFPLNTVFEASKKALQSLGQLTRESTLLESTNQVRALEGKVQDTDVWIRVEAVDAQVTSVIVQARSTWIGSNVPVAHEVEKQIALNLVP